MGHAAVNMGTKVSPTELFVMLKFYSLNEHLLNCYFMKVYTIGGIGDKQ